MSTTAIDTRTPLSAINQWTVGDNGWHNVTEESTAIYVGRSEFYSGLQKGEEVRVHRTTYFRPDGSVSSVSVHASNGGAWLSINDESDLRAPEPTEAPALVPIREFDWISNGLQERLITCRNHTTGLWMTKNPTMRTLHFLRPPFGMPGECPCPFSDLCVIVDPTGLIGKEFQWAGEDDHGLRFRIDPNPTGGSCEECAASNVWSPAVVVATCIQKDSQPWYGYRTWLCADCARYAMLTEEEKQQAEFAPTTDNGLSETIVARDPGEQPERDITVAWGRDESEPCQRGTVGCSTNHDYKTECQAW